MTGNSERTVLNDRYEIQQRIGRGGMADVFLARDLLLDRPVAIKVLFPEFATDPNFVERFRREAQSAANLNHPNIVSVYDWGKYANTYFMAMEYVQGRTLADILRVNGQINSVQAAEIAGEVAAALGFAHRNGVVHRDIKPANILIGANGQVKVADFGIARAMNAPTESNLTQVGAVMGTATYFSPEQAQGAQPDPRSDLYSLGIVLYEMVGGRPPFSGDNPVSIAYKQVHDAPQPLNQVVADVPRSFEAIVAKLLAKKPDVRYPNAETLREDLRRFRAGEPVHALTSAIGTGTLPATAAMPRADPTVSAPTTVSPRTTVMAPTAGVQRTTMAPRTTMSPQAAVVEGDGGGNRTVVYSILGVLAVVIVIVGGILLFNALKDDGAEGSTPSTSSSVALEFALPDVITMSIEEASQTLIDLQLTVSPEAVANPAVAAGEVYATDPAPNALVVPGQEIKLTFNPAATTVVINDQTGKTLDQATADLAAQALTINPVVSENSDTAAEGTVIRTEPPAGTEVQPGSGVTIVISTGPNKLGVPEVAGQSQDAANSILSSEPYGFKVGVQTQPSASVAKGTVISTDPPASTAVNKGAAVTLIVSSGPAQVAVPPVEGLTEAQARNQLTGLGLVPDVQYIILASGSSDDGRVISQNVQSGTKVDPNTTIRLRVGKAVAATTTTTTTAPPATTLPPTTTAPATTTTRPPTTTTVAPTTTTPPPTSASSGP